ncbi:DUF2231 domain-containing protein [Nocardia goodfellowii]
MNVHTVLRGVERAAGLDRPAAVLAALIDRVLGQGRGTEWLRGSWLGHPVHPLLVTVPIGAWSSAAMLRAAGRYDSAQRLVLIGLTATAPTVVAGLAEVPGLDTAQRRVVLVHAFTNTVGSALFLGTYLRRDHPRQATIFGGFGLAAIGAGGALGGHLSYALAVGVHRWQTIRPSATRPQIAPARATSAGHTS